MTTTTVRGRAMTITFGDICLCAIAVAVWLMFLFGLNTVG